VAPETTLGQSGRIRCVRRANCGRRASVGGGPNWAWRPVRPVRQSLSDKVRLCGPREWLLPSLPVGAGLRAGASRRAEALRWYVKTRVRETPAAAGVGSVGCRHQAPQPVASLLRGGFRDPSRTTGSPGRRPGAFVLGRSVRRRACGTPARASSGLRAERATRHRAADGRGENYSASQVLTFRGAPGGPSRWRKRARAALRLVPPGSTIGLPCANCDSAWPRST